MPEPFLRVVRGDATAEEIAALVAVLSAAAAAGAAGGGRRRPSAWSDRSDLLRKPLRHGPDAWRLSARRGVV